MTRRLILCAAALLGASCRGTPLPEAEPASDDALRRSLVADLVPPAAPAAMVQRWVLAYGSGEAFFTLYVRLDPPGSMAVVALSDLGGTLASGTWTDGVTAVERDSRAFPARLVEGILRALAPVFLPGPPEEYELVRLRDGAPALRRTHEGTHTLRWRSGPAVARVAAGRTRTESAATITTSADGRPRSFRLEGAGFEATVDVARAGGP
jgi:hypothetical protein